MYIQKRAYAVSCAMQVVQPVMPQGHPGEDVKPVACGVLREHTQGELYVALENPREAALLVRWRIAEVESASHVSCPIPKSIFKHLLLLCLKIRAIPVLTSRV